MISKTEIAVAPGVVIIANHDDITSKIRDRFKSLRLVDEAGTTTDTVEITLADHDPEHPIQIPPTGAELEVFIGYDGQLERKGLFVCDEIELSGYPQEMVIRARAAVHEESKGGMKALQSRKTRSWPKGTTIGELVKRIAGEHRMQPAVSAALASVPLPHTDQSRESDMNLLLRIAKNYDAIAKPAGGALVFVRRGEALTASGAPMPRFTLTPSDGGGYRVTVANREKAGTAIAYYRDTRKAQRREVKVGDGEPVVQLRMAYADAVTAEHAARAEHRKRARKNWTLSYTFPGRPEVSAETVAVMSGFREGVDGEWLVTHAEHYIGPMGYRCTIECERPNEATAEAGAAVDQVEAATVVE